ncbi:MAG: hypothetical protein V4727_12745 [Verrucomicrobiota bacterium]
MDLTLNDFVLGVLFATLIAVLVIGTFSRFLHLKNERKLKRLVTVCRLCGHVFLNRDSAELVHCDACHAVNRRKGNGKLG